MTNKSDDVLEDHGFELFSKENPESVYNTVFNKYPSARGSEDKLLKHIFETAQNSEYRDMPPEALAAQFEEHRTVNMLRRSFWNRYHIMRNNKLKKFVFKVVFEGICPRETVDRLFKRHSKAEMHCVYFLTPSPYHEALLDDLMDRSYDRLRDILNLPVVDKKGNPVAAAINGILKAHILLENRVFGTVAQKHQIESKVHSLNQNISARIDVPEDNDLDGEIRKLLNETGVKSIDLNKVKVTQE